MKYAYKGIVAPQEKTAGAEAGRGKEWENTIDTESNRQKTWEKTTGTEAGRKEEWGNTANIEAGMENETDPSTRIRRDMDLPGAEERKMTDSAGRTAVLRKQEGVGVLIWLAVAWMIAIAVFVFYGFWRHQHKMTTVTGQVSEQAGRTETEVPERKRAYLTFDDGPSEYTGEILDILKENDVKATFFVVGKEEAYYDAYRRIVEEGHSIGLHSFTHDYEKFYRSVDSFSGELTALNDLLYEVTGVRSSIFRFPGGSSNRVSALPVQEYIRWLNENGIRYYDWNALSGDAVNIGMPPKQLVSNIMEDAVKHQDTIILMHDLPVTHTTVESLQLLIDTLRAEGYELLPIDEQTPLIQHVCAP